MFCAIVGFLMSPLVCNSLDLLPQARPAYADFVQWYGPDPDCANRNSHIRYLSELKQFPVQREDNQLQYDRAIDQYIARLGYYCQ